MSEWNPASVEKAIYECVQRIEVGVVKCDEAYREFLKLDHAFDVAEAKARLRYEGLTVQDRKDKALLDTIEERDKRDVADATYKLMDRQMKALMAELDALRSIGTSVCQAYAGAGRGNF